MRSSTRLNVNTFFPDSDIYTNTLECLFIRSVFNGHICNLSLYSSVHLHLCMSYSWVNNCIGFCMSVSISVHLKKFNLSFTNCHIFPMIMSKVSQKGRTRDSMSRVSRVMKALIDLNISDPSLAPALGHRVPAVCSDSILISYYGPTAD